MNPKQTRPRAPTQVVRSLTTLICAVLILLVGTVSWAVQTQQAPKSTSQDEKLTNDQLDSLVAPIALYPDPLFSLPVQRWSMFPVTLPSRYGVRPIIRTP